VFGLVVHFTCADEAAAAGFDQLATETVELIRRHEPGTLVYAVHRIEGHPRVRVFYELYRDRAAFDEHERQAHTRRFLISRNQYLAGEPTVEFLTLQVSKGVDRGC
jgi:quinol monooxygenase YgiN